MLFLFVFVVIKSISYDIENFSKKVDEDNSQTIESQLEDFEDVK